MKLHFVICGRAGMACTVTFKQLFPRLADVALHGGTGEVIFNKMSPFVHGRIMASLYFSVRFERNNSDSSMLLEFCSSQSFVFVTM